MKRRTDLITRIRSYNRKSSAETSYGYDDKANFGGSGLIQKHFELN